MREPAWSLWADGQRGSDDIFQSLFDRAWTAAGFRVRLVRKQQNDGSRRIRDLLRARRRGSGGPIELPDAVFADRVRGQRARWIHELLCTLRGEQSASLQSLLRPGYGFRVEPEYVASRRRVELCVFAVLVCSAG